MLFIRKVYYVLNRGVILSNIKSLIKLIIYTCLKLLFKPFKAITPNSLLLIRLDAIGDYILFRNYIEALKKSKKYSGYSITLLGNSAWKSLSEELDIEFVDKFIWLDRDKFHRDFIYTFRILQKIASKGYEVVLSPVYSRDLFFSDIVVKYTNAKEKIGSLGDLSNIRKWQKNISDKYYTKLIDADTRLMFEFSRNKEFFENLLDIKLDIKKPHIKLKPKKLIFKLTKGYAILFIGASDNYRKWGIKKFAQVAKHLNENHNLEIVLCGGPYDKNEAKKFQKYFFGDYTDLVGKTSLIDFIYVISNGSLMISNETSGPHIASALEMKNIFVISNGNHFGRFTPYPKSISKNHHVIYHPLIEKDLGDHEKLLSSYGFGSNLDINDICADSVVDKIDEILNSRAFNLRKIIFLDRDGVINHDCGYVNRIEDFHFIDGVFEACKKLSKCGFEIIIFTNQSGIERGYFTQEDFDNLTTWMIDEFEKNGIKILKVYFCPHSPDKNCNCRKPKTGMIDNAKKDFNISLDNSWVVGDKMSDIYSGLNAGIDNFTLIKSKYNINVDNQKFDNLLAAAMFIIRSTS